MKKITDDMCIKELVPKFCYRNHLTLLSGAPFTGKSVITQWAGIQLATGQPGFWGKIDPIKVLFCSERTSKLVHTQLRDCCLELPDEEDFRLICKGDMEPKDSGKFDLNPLMDIQKRIGTWKPDLIFLDVLFEFVPSDVRVRGTNDYVSTKHHINRIGQYANKVFDAGIVAIHHMAKEKEGESYTNDIYSSHGSVSIVGSVALFIGLRELKRNPKLIAANFYSHVGEAQVTKNFLLRHGQPVTELNDLELNFWMSEESKTSDELGIFQRQVLEFVSDNPSDKAIVIKAAQAVHPDWQNNNINRAIRSLVKYGLIRVNHDEGLIWKAPTN